ncbi:MAG: hypothetical protein GY849_06055 [Deltaproteobacteria bacterium]|nr:hypothetical protein [Deltaproteobacteria bacterium]
MEIYKVLAGFQKEERFGLTSQVRWPFKRVGPRTLDPLTP